MWLVMPTAIEFPHRVWYLQKPCQHTSEERCRASHGEAHAPRSWLRSWHEGTYKVAVSCCLSRAPQGGATQHWRTGRDGLEADRNWNYLAHRRQSEQRAWNENKLTTMTLFSEPMHPYTRTLVIAAVFVMMVLMLLSLFSFGTRRRTPGRAHTAGSGPALPRGKARRRRRRGAARAGRFLFGGLWEELLYTGMHASMYVYVCMHAGTSVFSANLCISMLTYMHAPRSGLRLVAPNPSLVFSDWHYADGMVHSACSDNLFSLYAKTSMQLYCA